MASLIDGHVSSQAAERAASALGSYISKVRDQANEDELLGAKEDFVWLVVSVKRMSPEKNMKPHRIPLSHPLVDPRLSSICLLTKDPQREYKDLLETKGVKFISRVVGVTKLKGKFKPYEARRQLLNEHGLFLADDRIVPMLPNLLGKMFFDAKKQPIPVCITKSNIKTELERAISATYMHQNKGTCTSIKIASATHSTAQIVKNLEVAIPSIVAKIPDGWGNIQSLHIKTSQSASLPIWTCDLASGDRWTVTSDPGIPLLTQDSEIKSGKRRRDETTEEASNTPAQRKKPFSATSATSQPEKEGASKPGRVIRPKKVVKSSKSLRAPIALASG